METLEGAGRAANSLSPARARALIREGVANALSRDPTELMPQAAESYEAVVEFCNPSDAYRASWYPGARAHGPRAVAISATDFFDIQRALRFMLA